MPQPRQLTASERRENVRRVNAAAAELEQVENALADAAARLPALLAQVRNIRTTITTALSGARPTSAGDEEKDEPDE